MESNGDDILDCVAIYIIQFDFIHCHHQIRLSALYVQLKSKKYEGTELFVRTIK